jgi:hypothetical protein
MRLAGCRLSLLELRSGLKRQVSERRIADGCDAAAGISGFRRDLSDVTIIPDSAPLATVEWPAAHADMLAFLKQMSLAWQVCRLAGAARQARTFAMKTLDISMSIDRGYLPCSSRHYFNKLITYSP